MPQFHSTLLVDDDPTTNFLNQHLLEKLGLTGPVRVALNGREALHILAADCTDATTNCPVLIFLDINMPLMNGFAFLDAYQQLLLPERQAMVIVMLTTSVHPRDIQRLKTLPVNAFLSKPLNRAKLEEVLGNYAGQLSLAEPLHPGL